jgi:hypothetical protein
MKLNGTQTVKTLTAIVVVGCILLLAGQITSAKPTGETAVQAAVCQIVYPVDQFASTDGYQYLFLGNGFFINEDGYIVTAAHLLSWFQHGEQPYILIGPPTGPRRLLEASLVAIDTDHDVAVLHATPNPFLDDKQLAYLPLSNETPAKDDTVLSASFRPSDINNAHTGDIPLQDFARTRVLNYQFYRENETYESELLLFSQQVVPGQSGSPLVSANSMGAVGVVVGRWLRPAVIPTGANGAHMTISPGAALRIHYAISLLEANHVSWHMASVAAVQPGAAPQQTEGFQPAVPISVVAAPYPPAALFGGEVLLDALIGEDGKPTDVRVAEGDSPFLDAALKAVSTWIFAPARADGRAVGSRIGIVFQFPQSFLPKLTATERKYGEPFADSSERGALPVQTVEPPYPVLSVADGSVALYELVDADGKITSTSVLRNVDTLTPLAEAASQQWQFAPGKQAGAKTGSAVIVVVTFRRPT